MLQRSGLFLLLLALLASLKGHAQQLQLDSLLQLEKTYLQEDSVRAKLLTDIARRYYSINPATGIIFAEKGIQLAEKLPDKFLFSALASFITASCAKACRLIIVKSENNNFFMVILLVCYVYQKPFVTQIWKIILKSCNFVSQKALFN